MTVRQASAIDDLSGGRLVLGLGAGWQEREHEVFGVPFHDFPTRFAMLEDALEMTRLLYGSATPVSYEGKHFSLQEATLLPRPERQTPILIGGNGPKRTLPLAARYADEWNAVFCNIEVFRDLCQRLDNLVGEQGRAPSEVKRSLMTGVRWCKNEAAVNDMLDGMSKRLGRAASIPDLNEMGLLAGTSAMIAGQLAAFEEAGCARVMLQVPDYDNLSMVDHWAKEILPQFHE